MDFFCLSPNGIRAGYASRAIVSGLPRSQRGKLLGRVVVLLSANHRYGLRGVRHGTTLGTAKHRLRLGRAFHVGRNDWYLFSNGRSRGVLKVQHGVVGEVGIANKRLTANRKASARFLRLFQ